MFAVVQVLYWLALSTWFGGVLAVAAGAPVVFRTVRESDPTLPGVRATSLGDEHATLLAGDVVNNLLRLLGRVELACAAAVGVALAGQWAILWPDDGQRALAAVRTGLWAAAAGLALYGGRVARPRADLERRAFIDLADDDPDRANAARDRFDRAHAEGVNVLLATLFLLLGLVLFSGTIAPSSALALD